MVLSLKIEYMCFSDKDQITFGHVVTYSFFYKKLSLEFKIFVMIDLLTYFKCVMQ